MHTLIGEIPDDYTPISSATKAAVETNYLNFGLRCHNRMKLCKAQQLPQNYSQHVSRSSADTMDGICTAQIVSECGQLRCWHGTPHQIIIGWVIGCVLHVQYRLKSEITTHANTYGYLSFYPSLCCIPTACINELGGPFSYEPWPGAGMKSTFTPCTGWFGGGGMVVYL